jgi:hypothetical protein
MPADFIAPQLSPAACTAHAGNFSGRIANIRALSAQRASRLDADTSLTVNHDFLSLRWRDLLAISYAAAARQNAAQAEQIVETLVTLADRRTLLDAPTLAQSKARGPCWANGDPNAPCPYHTAQNVAFTFVAMLISAIVLEEFIGADDRAALDAYFARAHRGWIGPLAEDQARSDGIYELAGMGIGELAYARWTDDAGRAAREINRRIAAFRRKIEPEGYIDNNSYRGYRGYWYHTLGAENVYGYAMIARGFGVDLFTDPRTAGRLSALAQRTAAAGPDGRSFLDLPRRGDNSNAAAADAEPHMHQFATNLPTVMRREFGTDPPLAAAYLSQRRFETMNRLVMFDASCYYASNG